MGQLPEEVSWSELDEKGEVTPRVTSEPSTIPEVGCECLKHLKTADFPGQVMYLISPNGQQSQAGKYELVKEMANGYPCWQSARKELVLYSGSDGCWYFGPLAAVRHLDFDCNLGKVCSQVHGGVPWRFS